MGPQSDLDLRADWTPSGLAWRIQKIQNLNILGTKMVPIFGTKMVPIFGTKMVPGSQIASGLARARTLEPFWFQKLEPFWYPKFH